MSLSRIDLIFDRLPGAYLILLPNPPYFTIAGFNQARSEVTNSFGREVLGKDLFEVFPDNPDDPNASGVKNLGASLSKVLESGLPHKMPVQKYDILVDGVFEERYWRPENIPVFDEEGKLIYIIHSVSDVTSEVLLRRSEANYHYLFNHNPASSIIWDPNDFRILEVNQTACLLLDYSSEDLTQMTVFDIRPEEEHDRIRYLANYIRLGTPLEKVQLWKLKRRDGALSYLQVFFHKTLYAGREAVLALGNDVSDKFELESRMRDQHERSVQELTDAVLQAQENERRQVGQELHDSVIQILNTAKLYIERSLAEPGRSMEPLKEGHTLLQSAITELHALSESLSPAWLADGSFIGALRDLFSQVQNANGFILESHLYIEERELSVRLRVNIYRIIQEQLNNVAKYAKATVVNVLIKNRSSHVYINIKDNGVGFDQQKVSRGLGFSNMISRAKVHDGDVIIDSFPGQGCEVRIFLNGN